MVTFSSKIIKNIASAGILHVCSDRISVRFLEWRRQSHFERL